MLARPVVEVADEPPYAKPYQAHCIVGGKERDQVAGIFLVSLGCWGVFTPPKVSA